MTKKIRSQNFFIAQTTQTIPASGAFSVTLNLTLLEDRGFIVFDFNNAALREVVYYDSRVGNQINVKAENRNGPQAHAVGANAQINDTAEFQNYISEIASSLGYIEKTGGLTVQVWGGYIAINNTSYLVADTNFTLPAAQTSYIWFNPVTVTYLQTLNPITITGTKIATIITGASTISSIVQEVASFGMIAGVDDSTIQYDIDKKLKVKTIFAGNVGFNLNDVLDVGISTPANGESLVFQGGQWINQFVSGGGGGGGGGSVNSVASANADISVASPTTNPVLTLNSGVGANQILKLDGTAKLPAVDGSQLTNLPSVAGLVTVANQTARLALSSVVNDIVSQVDTNLLYQLRSLPASTNANWAVLGPIGGSDKNYTQAFIAQTTVVVTHSLAKYPSVTIIDVAGNEIIGDALHNSINQVTLTFNSTVSGTAICN